MLRLSYAFEATPQHFPLDFTECDLLDFADPQIGEYARHWCTAVRLARNEPEEEARREGIVDGERIVDGFKDHPYIPNLARSPLMLSAICLVNYFEGGQLPKDRAENIPHSRTESKTSSSLIRSAGGSRPNRPLTAANMAPTSAGPLPVAKPQMQSLSVSPRRSTSSSQVCLSGMRHCEP